MHHRRFAERSRAPRWPSSAAARVGHRASWAQRLACALALLVAQPAQANVYLPYVGARTLAMGGAQRALGSSNDVLLLNPAAMAAVKRYSAQLSYATGGDHIHRLLMSTVDSKTGNLAAGLSYMRVWGRPSDNHPALGEVRFGLAYSLLPVLSIGLSGQNISGHFTEPGVDEAKRVRAFNSTLGAMLHLGPLFGLGFAWENFAAKQQNPLLPKALSFGAGLSLSLVRLAADFRLLPRAQGPFQRDLGTGLELSLARMLAVRGGYRLAMRPTGEPQGRLQWLTAGLGLALGALSVDASMEKPLHSREWRLATGMSWFL